MESSLIYFFHGTLGCPEDWLPLQREIRKLAPQIQMNFKSADLYEEPPASLADFVETWRADALKEAGPRILIGYSMGARLAMELLMRDSSLWAGAVLIGGGMAPQSTVEKENRFAWDCAWAQKFLESPWSEVLREWNELELFKGRSLPENRAELEGKREHIAKAFTEWSPARQVINIDSLKTLNLQILWVAGALDEKYCKVASEAALCSPLFSSCVIEGAAHRVHLEKPEILAQRVLPFLLELIQAKK